MVDACQGPCRHPQPMLLLYAILNGSAFAENLCTFPHTAACHILVFHPLDYIRDSGPTGS